jgi:hypothetical protein
VALPSKHGLKINLDWEYPLSGLGPPAFPLTDLRFQISGSGVFLDRCLVRVFFQKYLTLGLGLSDGQKCEAHRQFHDTSFREISLLSMNCRRYIHYCSDPHELRKRNPGGR